MPPFTVLKFGSARIGNGHFHFFFFPPPPQLQCQQLLSKMGRGWSSPTGAPTSKSISGNQDCPGHKFPGKRRTVIARYGPYKDEYCTITKGYHGNGIHTTKYTLVSFIPMNLFEQFHRAANLYFLFLVLLNWVPVVEAFQKEITMIPLVVVLCVIAFKDALEDYRRYRFDKMINSKVTKVYCGKQRQYVDQHWKDICVGDFVYLSCNEIIPADMVLLHSSNPDGICRIETANLDGETNLKQKQVIKGLAWQDAEVSPEAFASRIECESPNDDLNRFRGFMEHANKTRVGLHNENLLLRSCTIRNTESVVGIVVYAGHETKAMKNNSGPRYKRSKLERRLNTDILWSLVLLLFMCLTAAIGHGIWLSGLKNPPFLIPDGTSPALAGFYLFWTMIIVLQVLIPISLYVSIEIVKLGQIYLIQSDVDFYDEKQALGMQCRALNITEDLGQIQYIFSDKTGTLTENKMVFRRCSIAGVEYPHEDNSRRLEMYQAQDCDSELDPSSITVKSKSSLLSLSCRSLNCNQSSTSLHLLAASDGEMDLQGKPLGTTGCHDVAFSSRTVSPDVKRLIFCPLSPSHHEIKPHFTFSPYLNDRPEDDPQETAYIVDFFLAITLCNTVVVSSPRLPEPQVKSPHMAIKSLESMKLLFQRFSVPQFASFSTSRSNAPADSPSSFAQKLFSRGSLSTPATPQDKVEETKGLQITAPMEWIPEMDDHARGVAKAGPCGLEAESEALVYAAESPDEAALVHATRAYRCTLWARSSNQVLVELPGLGRLAVNLLHILPFDSFRKRMSVVVRHPLTNQVVVYTKGADSVIIKLVAPLAGVSIFLLKHIREQTQRHLDNYAREGLRTLCVATKVLEETEYSMWLKKHTFAETCIENREKLLLESADELETNLTLLGATGILDRLQEDVPETIEALQGAGIHVWVLTGDKQETAVNIACSCGLLRPSDKLLTINCDSKDACEALLLKLIRVVAEASDSKGDEPSGHMLVIDGQSLELALEDSLQEPFLDLAKHCRAVVCCRSTPLQKSQVVRLVQDRLGVMTLAIGDGANDVSMIQVANIGVGISGQEGMQAVMSSDFAISRFKHLRKLLLVHGHWCYTRLANMTLYFFYKNVAYVNLLFWYQFYCGFSGSTMTNYWMLIFFNLLFTSAPPLLYGILDRDASADILQQLPVLYRAGHFSQAYLPSTFWCTMLDALYQSLVCFFVPYFAYSGSDISIFSFGTPVNTSALLVILLQQVIQSHTLTWLHGVVLVGSALFYFVFMLVFSATCVTCNSPSNPLGVDIRHMQDPQFYCVCVLTTVLALLPRYSTASSHAHMHRLGPEEQRRGIQNWRTALGYGEPSITVTAADGDPRGLFVAVCFALLKVTLNGGAP
uniref:Phospholipid-transporting ATPase n=1 Tax=Scleropages formosus TaxID=113540 RepID=A0A8C9RRY5_SCLFO